MRSASCAALVLRRWGRDAAAATPRRAPAARWLAVPVAAPRRCSVAHHAPAARAAGPGELVISFLDVGQGDATLIQLDGTAVLVDTGPPDGPILTRLKEAGIKRLDALMLTHAETDHEGAAAAVIRAYAPRLVVDGGAGWPSRVQRDARRALAAPRIHAPAAGEAITLGAADASACCGRRRAPPGWRANGNPNDNALVTRLEANGAVACCSPPTRRARCSRRWRPQPVDVLKVSHHGSADPGLPALLTRLQPRIAAIEVGRHNTYGHPAPSTLARAARRADVVRTDRDGTVRLHAAHGRMWVER